MRKLVCSFLLFLLFAGTILAQSRATVKNVILMIPDGTSLSAISAARWYQRYTNPKATRLNIDDYICGTVLTYSSNAPIGDSAPTTSSYMTGYPSRAGWISTYPPADPKNDLLPIGVYEAYQPLATLMEAARIVQNKATGLVVTCEFPHATPADCSSHCYWRDKYEWIVPQIVHNQIDVLIGGGVELLTGDLQADLQKAGYGVFLNDLNRFRTYEGNKMWSLFGKQAMSYELDRDPSQQPSLAEMTEVALNKLSTNPNGFILMVEGSKIDWAAHDNDAAGIIHETLAFDKACGVAFDFARKNGETVVLVVPDHGNSGFSIGSSKCSNYSSLTKDELFAPIARIKTSRGELVERIQATEPAQLSDLFYENTGIQLTDEEYKKLLQTSDYKNGQFNEKETKGTRLSAVVAKIIDNHHCFGFTTGGHTGEEVFLAVYDPTPNRLTGHRTNMEINHYLRQSLGLEEGALENLTQKYFAKHTDVFAGYACVIVKKEGAFPVLEVTYKKKKLEIPAYANTVKFNQKEIKLNSVTVYVDKNDTFYLPQSLTELLQNINLKTK